MTLKCESLTLFSGLQCILITGLGLGQFAVALVSSAEVPTLASLSALRSLWQKALGPGFLGFSTRDTTLFNAGSQATRCSL